jgi:acyl-CoA synthetase (AMP-forming)/AMP-acid ligase II
MRNHPRYLEVLWGLWWAGLVAVPVNAKLHPREVEWIAANCGARWAFVTADVAPEPLAGIERQIDLESPKPPPCSRRCPTPLPCPPPSATWATPPGCSTPAAPPAAPRA